jgi:hypothetical protein
MLAGRPHGGQSTHWSMTVKRSKSTRASAPFAAARKSQLMALANRRCHVHRTSNSALRASAERMLRRSLDIRCPTD